MRFSQCMMSGKWLRKFHLIVLLHAIKVGGRNPNFDARKNNN